MMVSVAMCTYNGEKYLTQQLASIAQQSEPVSELVVCDDRSKDRTLEILQEFARNAPFPVHIHENEVNLGSTKNFEKCLLLCKGDILILCDQDDVWGVDKVRSQVEFLAGHPELDAVFSDANLIDDDGTELPHRLWDNFGFNQARQAVWQAGNAKEVLFRNYVVTGATLAIRRSVLDLLTPFPTHLGPYIHDAWMALALGVLNKIGFIDQPLLSYRVHASQQVGFGQKSDPVTMKDRWSRGRKEKMAPILSRSSLLKNVYHALLAIDGITPASLQGLANLQKHFEVRAGLPSNRLLRVAPVFRELVSGRYVLSSEHWWLPFLGDLLE